MSYCTKKCISIKIEQFVAMFPKRGKAIFKGVNHTFELIVFLYLIPFAWKYLLSAIANGQTSPAMGIPDVLCAGSTVGGIYPVSDPGIPEMDH